LLRIKYSVGHSNFGSRRRPTSPVPAENSQDERVVRTCRFSTDPDHADCAQSTEFSQCLKAGTSAQLKPCRKSKVFRNRRTFPMCFEYAPAQLLLHPWSRLLAFLTPVILGLRE